MANVWIQDLWVVDHVVKTDDGSIAERRKPTSPQLKSINKLPEQFRSSRFGKGSRWRVNWIEEIDGKPVRKTENYQTKTLAEIRVVELAASLAKGTHVTRELKKQLFSDVAAMWLRSKQKIRESTFKRYRDELDRYVLPKWGSRTLDSIESQHVEEWINELRNGTAVHAFNVKREQTKLEPATIKHIVRIVFGAVIKYAQNKGWIFKSPLHGVELPESDETNVDEEMLNAVELKALFDAGDAHNPQDGRVLRVLAFTGLRIGELIALRVRDWDGQSITVRQTVTVTDSGMKFGVPKGGKARSIPVAPTVVSAINIQVEGMGPDEFIFRNSRGGHLHPNNWRNRSWSKIVAASGLEIENFTPHSLRHTAASMAISANANILVVSRMLGHTKPNITLSTYSHLYKSDFDAIGQLMEDHFNAGLESD